jgi:hypothetical protein
MHRDEIGGDLAERLFTDGLSARPKFVSLQSTETALAAF